MICKTIIDSKTKEFINYVNGKFYPNNTPFLYPRNASILDISNYAFTKGIKIDLTAVEMIEVEVNRIEPKVQTNE